MQGSLDRRLYSGLSTATRATLLCTLKCKPQPYDRGKGDVRMHAMGLEKNSRHNSARLPLSSRSDMPVRRTYTMNWTSSWMYV